MRDFESIAVAELPVLYRVALRLTGNGSEAEDLVGTCLLKATVAWTEFDGRHARAWLIRILRNEHLMSLRRDRSTVELTEADEPGDEGFWQEVGERITASALLDQLDRLPDEYRLPIVLCDVEEMDHAEAALALDLKPATLRSRLFRGRKILRSRLVHYEDPS